LPPRCPYLIRASRERQPRRLLPLQLPPWPSHSARPSEIPFRVKRSPLAASPASARGAVVRRSSTIWVRSPGSGLRQHGSGIRPAGPQALVDRRTLLYPRIGPGRLASGGLAHSSGRPATPFQTPAKLCQGTARNSGNPQSLNELTAIQLLPDAAQAPSGEREWAAFRDDHHSLAPRGTVHACKPHQGCTPC
jgi:hypothetical protein